MRFTDELERQLLEAARREERPVRHPWGRSLISPARRLAAPAFALAAVLLAAVAIVPRLVDDADEHPVAPPSVFGVYTAGSGENEVRLTLVPGGYLLQGLIDNEGIHMNGTVELKGMRIRFIRPSENELPEAVGGHHVSAAGLPSSLTPLQKRDCLLSRSATYRRDVTATQLRLELVRDICVARRRALTRAPLERRGG